MENTVLQKIKIYKAVTPSQRQLCLLNKNNLQSAVLKNLLHKKRKITGRNNSGHITVRHKGGGNTKKYRIIDVYKDIYNIPGVIRTIEYNTCSSNFISLIYYLNGVYSYIPSIEKIALGTNVMNHYAMTHALLLGDCGFLKYITVGAQITSIETQPGIGITLSKSAGVSSTLLKRTKNYCLIKIPSGRVIKISIYCKATLGTNANKEYRYINLGKAGRKRWLGIRPSVRGVAMNPVDHPHGGGEGKKTKKAFPRTPWGKRK